MSLGQRKRANIINQRGEHPPIQNFQTLPQRGPLSEEMRVFREDPPRTIDAVRNFAGAIIVHGVHAPQNSYPLVPIFEWDKT